MYFYGAEKKKRTNLFMRYIRGILYGVKLTADIWKVVNIECAVEYLTLLHLCVYV